MRLSSATLGALSGSVERFSYDRQAQSVGIVHIGIGAFHRAHQAHYTDRAMDAGDRDWSILGVSLRSAAVADQLNPQDGLYTVCERSVAGSAMRLVGSVREVLMPSSPNVLSCLAATQTRIVSLTITEKGYCRAADGSLDMTQAGAGTVYPLLADAMRARRDRGADGLTLLCCDNLAHNGAQLITLMRTYLDAREPDLLPWFERECTCPSTMVDRIVPASTEADRAELEAAIGLADHGAVFTETYSQWIIEDRFAGPRPRWQDVGAELVADVEPYETAKLRMLNGAHSALAYLGLEKCHTYVHEAIADPSIRVLIDRLMRQEAAPTIRIAPGQDLQAYADALLTRFANPALRHRLSQIAMDGSQKLPQRWLATLAERRSQGGNCPAILVALGSWLRHARGDNGVVDDPLAGALRSAWDDHGHDGVVQAIFGKAGLIPSGWTPTAADELVLLAKDAFS